MGTVFNNHGVSLMPVVLLRVQSKTLKLVQLYAYDCLQFKSCC